MRARRGEYDMAIVDYDIAVRLATDEMYGAYVHLRRGKAHAMRSEYEGDSGLRECHQAARLT